MKEVLVWGTFDLLHEGHTAFLEHALRFGDRLHVIVVPDKVVRENKKRNPVWFTERRKNAVQSLEFVTRAYIDCLGDGLETIKDLKVDVICVGEDQDQKWVDGLLKVLRSRGLNPEVVKLPLHGFIHTTDLTQNT